MPQIARNSRAKFDYEVLDTIEVGLVLEGHEVKSARDGNISLKGSYAGALKGELWLLNAHIGVYKKAGNLKEYDPTRSRKLLIHKRELEKLLETIESKGLTLVPISMYTRGRRLKVELGLAKGKKKYEKRETIKKKTIDRDIRERMKFHL